MTDAPAPAATPIDWTDPCARAQALTTAYFTLLSGGQETEIRTRRAEAEEMVKFQPSNLATLRSEMQDAVDACAAKNAGIPISPKRFAITARHKRPRCGFSPFTGRFP